MPAQVEELAQAEELVQVEAHLRQGLKADNDLVPGIVRDLDLTHNSPLFVMFYMFHSFDFIFGKKCTLEYKFKNKVPISSFHNLLFE